MFTSFEILSSSRDQSKQRPKYIQEQYRSGTITLQTTISNQNCFASKKNPAEFQQLDLLFCCTRNAQSKIFVLVIESANSMALSLVMTLSGMHAMVSFLQCDAASVYLRTSAQNTCVMAEWFSFPMFNFAINRRSCLQLEKCEIAHKQHMLQLL